jgi:hypothetical protein
VKDAFTAERMVAETEAVYAGLVSAAPAAARAAV